VPWRLFPPGSVSPNGYVYNGDPWYQQRSYAYQDTNPTVSLKSSINAGALASDYYPYGSGKLEAHWLGANLISPAAGGDGFVQDGFITAGRAIGSVAASPTTPFIFGYIGNSLAGGATVTCGPGYTGIFTPVHECDKALNSPGTNNYTFYLDAVNNTVRAHVTYPNGMDETIYTINLGNSGISTPYTDSELWNDGTYSMATIVGGGLAENGVYWQTGVYNVFTGAYDLQSHGTFHSAIWDAIYASQITYGDNTATGCPPLKDLGPLYSYEFFLGNGSFCEAEGTTF
jgi:hypothetical protein